MKPGLFYVFLLITLLSCHEKKENENKRLSGPHAEMVIHVGRDNDDTVGQSKREELIYKLKSDEILENAMSKSGIKNTASDIREKLDLTLVDASGVVVAKFYHTNEQEAKSFLENWYKAAAENLMTGKYGAINRELEIINKTLDSLKGFISKKQQEPDAFEARVSPAEAYLLFEEMSKLQLKYKHYNEIKEAILNSHSALTAISNLSFNEDEDLYLKKSLEEIKSGIEKRETICGDVTDAACRELNKKTDQNIKNLIIYLDNSKEAIKQSVGELEEEIKKLPQYPAEREDDNILYLDLEKEEKTYQLLMERKAELMIKMAGITSPVKILERPEYKKE